jgi:hypothetical protein
MRKFSRRWVPHSLNAAQKVARAEAAKMLRILQESETNELNGITAGDESWFQQTVASSKMFARSAADVIQMTQQAIHATNYNLDVPHRNRIYYVRYSSKR